MPTLVYSSKDMDRSHIKTFVPSRKAIIESNKFFDALYHDAFLRKKVQKLVREHRKDHVGFKSLFSIKIK